MAKQKALAEIAAAEVPFQEILLNMPMVEQVAQIEDDESQYAVELG